MSAEKCRAHRISAPRETVEFTFEDLGIIITKVAEAPFIYRSRFVVGDQILINDVPMLMCVPEAPVDHLQLRFVEDNAFLAVHDIDASTTEYLS